MNKESNNWVTVIGFSLALLGSPLAFIAVLHVRVFPMYISYNLAGFLGMGLLAASILFSLKNLKPILSKIALAVSIITLSISLVSLITPVPAKQGPVIKTIKTTETIEMK